MNPEALQELHELFDKVSDQVIAGVLRRVETGDFDGRTYAVEAGKWELGHHRFTNFASPCGCVKGSVAIESGVNPVPISVLTFLDSIGITYGLGDHALEKFAEGIHYGDTPETNERSRELLDAIVAYQAQRYTGIRARDISDEQFAAGKVFYKFEGDGTFHQVWRAGREIPGFHQREGYTLNFKEGPVSWAQVLLDDFLYVRNG